jgi:hypothetical protein
MRLLTKMWAIVVVVVAALPSRSAHAEIRELATRVADAYRSAGAHVETLPTHFLYEDETLVIALPSPGSARCTTIAIIGARGLSFHVGDADDESERSHSVGSALEIESCEPTAPSMRIRSDAGRGAVEIIVGRSQGRLPALRTVLPERVGGALPPNVDPGPIPALASPEKRADAAEANARRDGATLLPRAMAIANESGSGVVHVRIDRGCHRIELFSPETFAGRRKLRLDLDADLHDESGETLLARDRGEAADARLEVCFADGRDTLLGFGGALPGAPVIIARSSWPITNALPMQWGSDATRRLAAALHAHHVTPVHPPIALREGVVGSSSFMTELEMGACYVAVVAASRGAPRGMALRARVGAMDHADERGTADGAAFTAFCSGDQPRARVTVDARGSSLAWGFALYHVTSGAWDTHP